MDIIFQSGEFYMESNGLYVTLVGSIMGVTISGLFALIIFKWGIYNEKRKKEEIENKRISGLTAFLKTSMALILEKTIAQSNHLIDFAHELKTRNFKDKTLRVSAALKMDSIRSIPHSDLYKIFVFKKIENANRFNEFQAIIEFLNSYKEILPNVLYDFNRLFHKIQNEFGQEVSEFMALYDKYAPNYESDQNFDRKKTIRFWGTKIKKWKLIDQASLGNYRTDPYIVYDEIIKPVIDFIRDNSYESSVMDILYSANKCESHLKNFDHQRYMFRKKFTLDARSLIKSRNELKELINCL